MLFALDIMTKLLHHVAVFCNPSGAFIFCSCSLSNAFLNGSCDMYAIHLGGA